MKKQFFKVQGLAITFVLIIGFFSCTRALPEVGSSIPYPFSGNLLQDMGDHYLMGGDVILLKDDPYHTHLIEELGGQSRSRGIKKENIGAWPEGVVHYVLDPAFTERDLIVIQSSFDEWEAAANIQFVQRESWEPHTVNIQKINNPNIGGSASLGYSYSPIVNLSSVSRGVVIHELGHTLGFNHEHQRYDRDEYITILDDNIRSGYERNFNIIPQYDLSGNIYSQTYSSYDYESVMHYPERSFGINNSITIDARGNRLSSSQLSLKDVESAIGVYGPSQSDKKRYTYEKVYFRSNVDDEPLLEMDLVDHLISEIIVDVPSQEYGFRVFLRTVAYMSSDWNLYFGDNNFDGKLDFSGPPIVFEDTGLHRVRFHHQAFNYTIEKVDDIPDPGEESGMTVYFQKPDSFQSNEVNLYHWGNDETEVSWPGPAMEEESDGWYSYTFSQSTSSNLIFSNNGHYQTVDLFWEGDGSFVVEGEYYGKLTGKWSQGEPEGEQENEQETVEGDFVVYFHAPESFGSSPPYIYHWNNDESIVTWPGVPMTELGDRWYSYEFDQSSSSQLIFNNQGQGWQTQDLQRDSSGAFEASSQDSGGRWIGTWTER